MDATTPKSAGHITFAGDREFYQIGSEVYVAPVSAPIADCRTRTRIGRWECSRPQFDRFRAVIVGVPS